MGKGSSAPTSQGMPRFSGKGGIASPAPQNPYASQQFSQSRYASPLAGLGAIYGQYQQPSPQPSRNMMYRSEPEYQPQSSYITTPYAAPFQSQYQLMPIYTSPTRQIPAAFVPQSAKNYISPFGSQREQTFFDRTQTAAPTPTPTPTPTSTPSPDDYYYPPMASGGVIKAAAGRYLQGPGDGTSDSIPATIGNAQPARLADGEFVIDARTVSEIGNGSSNAGAKKLYAMMERVHKERKKAKRGQNSNADRFLPR
jgi:hypothetical protein